MLQRYYNANPWMRKYHYMSLIELQDLVRFDYSGSLYGYYLVRCRHSQEV